MTGSLAMLTTLDHVILVVRDLDAAARDYTNVLGLAPSWHGEHPHEGTANVLFRLENSYVELLAPASATADGPLALAVRAMLDTRGEGMAGLAFGTNDIDACRTELERRGLEPGPVIAGSGRDLATGAQRQWRRLTLPPSATRGVFLFPIQHDSPADALAMAVPTGAAAAAAHAIDHVVVQTTDGDGAKAVYGDGLGLRLAVDKEFPQWGVRLMFFRVGGITVEVAAALGSSTPPAEDRPYRATSAAPREDRLYGLTYRVRDIDAARERVAAAGLDVSEVRAGRRPGTRVATVRSGTCGVPTLLIAFEDGSR